MFEIIASILGGVLFTLLGIIGFFLKNILHRFDLVQETVIEMNTQLAGIAKDLTFSHDKVVALTSELTTCKTEIDKLRHKNHDVLNSLNIVSMKVDTVWDKCSTCNYKED